MNFGKLFYIQDYCQIKKTFTFAPDFVPWCNGSTTVFGTVCLGSNPGGTTFKTGFLTRFFVLKFV